MAKLKCIALTIVCFFCAQSASAAGGTCPSGANYTSLTNPTGPLVTLGSYGITSCYFVAANGADTNNGTSESTPWLHAPMMPNCSAKCATVQNQSVGIPAGTGLILRGGDTWHFGIKTDSAGNPSSGGTWSFATGQVPVGTSAHPIYLGVDQSWHSGSSWARPILTGDNPICNPNTLSGTCIQNTNTALDETVYVTSCPYQNGSSNNRLIDLDWVSYYITDNFELTGLCEMNPGQVGHYDDVIDIASLQGPQWFTNDYIHGWSHLTFAGNNGSAACTASAVCFNIYAFDGSTIAGTPGETFLKMVIDGSDSDYGAAASCLAGVYNTAYSVILYTSQCIANDFHVFHDNIYSNFYENGHSNMIESNNQSETAGTNVFYNNILYNLETSGNGSGGYGIALSPPVGTTDYVFNNVWWNVGPLQAALAVSSSNSQNVGALVAFNNTFQLQPGLMANIYGCPPAAVSSPSTFANNHYITDYTSVYNTINCTGSKTPVNLTNLQMTNPAAKANTSPHFNQYNAGEAYVYSPVASTNATVGAGTNVQPYCAALATAAASDSTLSDAALACENDIPYRCGYVTSTHSVSCQASTSLVARPATAAWDIGAYQMKANAPNPPKNPAAAVVQ